MGWLKRRLGLDEPEDRAEAARRRQDEQERRLRDLNWRVQVLQHRYDELDDNSTIERAQRDGDAER